MCDLIRLSAFADEYADSFDEQIALLVDRRIKNIEIRFIDGVNISELSEKSVVDAANKLRDASISVSAVGSPIGKIKIDGDMKEHLKTAEKVFSYAEILGAKNVRIFSFYIPENKSRSDCRNDVLSALEKLIDMAEKHGLTLCHENEAGIYGESPECCYDLLEHFGGRFKAVFDMGNFVLDGYRPYPDAYELIFPYIQYFHIKDALYAGAIVPPGCGEADIKNIISDYCSKADKPFFVTIEPHLQTFSGLNSLVGKSFDNPYKYENQKLAFCDALNKWNALWRQL